VFTRTELIILSFVAFFALAGAGLNHYAHPDKKTSIRTEFSPVKPLPTEPAAAKASGPERIDINSAGEAELARLPGVGTKLAVEIIKARERRGCFKKMSDLLEVKGIGKKKLAKMADHIKI
jgi:competence ComEA-like helix-hairpin-helix protein